MANLFYRNPRLAVLLVGLIAVAGFASFQALPRQEDPSLSRRFGTVTTFYPGASALRVETLVTEKIEEELQSLHEIVEIDSVSRTGVSLISVELADRFDDSTVDEVWSKVRDRIDDAAALLPTGAMAPEFEDRTSKAVTLLVGLSWEGADPPLAVMSRLAEELESRLRHLPGTKEAERFGESTEEVRITIDPAALAAVNLTAGDVSQAIARADAKRPAGQVRHAVNDLVLEVGGELTSIDRVRSVPVQRDGAGRILRVGDIASVERGVREPADALALLGGHRGIAIGATMEDNQRVDRWATRARGVVDEFASEVPRGITLQILFDQSEYTQERLSSLVGNLVLGVTIVLLVLLVMMGFRSALVVATALPLTLTAVLAELNFMGVPLHQMSITGLIIALGLLIDNAIVVVEEYNARARKGEAPAQAVAGTVRHLFVPLAASTLTTVLAFLPIALMPGGAGEFVGPISIGVCLAVVTSFLISMSLVVTLAAISTRGTTPEAPGEAPWWRAGASSERLERIYRKSLRTVLRRPAIGVAVSMVLPLLGFAVARTLPSQFFPANDRNQFQIQVALPTQASLEETLDTVRRARTLVHEHEEVVESHWFVGESAPRVFYNMMGADEGIANVASAFVTTRSPTATEALLPRLQNELVSAFPNARMVALPFEQGPPFEAPIEIRIVGPDLHVLRGLGEEVRLLLAQARGVTFTTAKVVGGEPKLVVDADEYQAQLSGLQLTDIADQLNARLEGSLGGTVLEGTEEVPVRVRVASSERDELGDILAGRVLAPGRDRSGREDRLAGVPLGAVAKLNLVPELGSITRRDGERSNTVQAYLEPYALISESLADFERLREEAGVELPVGYRIEFGGEDELRGEAIANLMAFALPLFVIMIGTIVLSFNSFRLAGVIFGVAILGIGLALFGVWLFGYPLGFVAIVGTMGLVGLAINDAIVVLAALRESPAADKAEIEGTVDVIVGASRHILATTFTTMGGFLPLILFGGRFWPPMATAIAGGVAGASILALYFVPSIYIALRRRDLRRTQPVAKESPKEALDRSPRAATAVAAVVAR